MLEEPPMAKRKSFFNMGFRAMIPVTTGVIPFGAVMGTVSAEANLSLSQTVTMNIILYAGASQLAATELMTQHAASVVVILTGLIINSRFLLYSAALSPVLRQASWPLKLFCAHTLTDQSYAVMTANERKLETAADHVQFYLGTAVCMWIVWNSSVVAGFVFGNFAPAEWALDYAVPLSFASLVVPTLRNSRYILVAAFSSAVSIALHGLPYRLGLITTALLAIALAAALTRRKALK